MRIQIACSQHQNHVHPKSKGKHGPHLSLTPVGLKKAAQDRSAAHRPTYRAPNTKVPEAPRGTAANKRLQVTSQTAKLKLPEH